MATLPHPPPEWPPILSTLWRGSPARHAPSSRRPAANRFGGSSSPSSLCAPSLKFRQLWRSSNLFVLGLHNCCCCCLFGAQHADHLDEQTTPTTTTTTTKPTSGSSRPANAPQTTGSSSGGPAGVVVVATEPTLVQVSAIVVVIVRGLLPFSQVHLHRLTCLAPKRPAQLEQSALSAPPCDLSTGY